MNNHLFLLERANGIATITANCPEKSNSMGLQYAAAFNRVLDEVEEDSSIRCLILTGAGKIYNGGGDLHEIMSPDVTDMEAELKIIRDVSLVIKRLYYFRIPVIAAMNGPAVGGGAAFGLVADFVIASETARYDLVFHKVGLSCADIGVPWLLSRAIGHSLASYHIMTTGSINAEEGYRLGLFVRVVKPADLLEAALSAAQKIVDASPQSVRISKLSLRQSAEMPFSAYLESETYLQSYAFRTDEHKRRIGEYRDRISNKAQSRAATTRGEG